MFTLTIEELEGESISDLTNALERIIELLNTGYVAAYEPSFQLSGDEEEE
jgi:hypothetical protein